MTNNHQGILLEVRGFQRIVVQRGFDMTHDLERGQLLLAKLDAFLADVPEDLGEEILCQMGVSARLKAAELLHQATTKGQDDDN